MLNSQSGVARKLTRAHHDNIKDIVQPGSAHRKPKVSYIGVRVKPEIEDSAADTQAGVAYNNGRVNKTAFVVYHQSVFSWSAND